MRLLSIVRSGLSVAGCMLLTFSASGQVQLRTLTGTVEDRQHEPLRGAVVVVQEEGTMNVVSYVTDRNGQFSFKRLSPDHDYKVTATYRGKSARAKELNHFDSKAAKVMVFVIKLDEE